MSILKKIRELTLIEWQVLLSSLILLPYCALSLRLKGFKKTREAFFPGNMQHTDLPPIEQLALARRISRAVDLAALYSFYRANCLKRSLVLCRQLHKHAIECDLKLGADLADQQFSAHAWVTHRGVILNDSRTVINGFSEFKSNSDHGA